MLYRALEDGETIKNGDVFFGSDNSQPIKVGSGAFDKIFDKKNFVQPFRPVKVPTFEEVCKLAIEMYDNSNFDLSEDIYKATLKLSGMEER